MSFFILFLIVLLCRIIINFIILVKRCNLKRIINFYLHFFIILFLNFIFKIIPEACISNCYFFLINFNKLIVESLQLGLGLIYFLIVIMILIFSIIKRYIINFIISVILLIKILISV